MGKTIRYHLYMCRPELSVITAGLLLIVGGNLLLGDGGLFSSYYTGIPMMLMIFALVYGTNLGVGQRHVALSMGMPRRTYFISMQVTMLLFAGVMTAYYAASVALYPYMDLKTPLMWQAPLWLYGLLCFVLTLVGVAVGFWIRKSKVWGALSLVGVMIACMGLFFVLMFVEQGDLFWILPLVMGILGIGMEIIVWRCIRRVEVR